MEPPMMSKLVIAVPWCAEHRARLDLLESTWLPVARRLGYYVAPYYLGLYNYQKLSEAIREMWHHLPMIFPGATHFAKVDTDTYLWPHRLRPDMWQEHDYVGNHGTGPLSDPYNFRFASGTMYILSRRAAEMVAHASVNFTHNGHVYEGDFAEDRFVGRIMHENNIPLHRETGIVWSEWWDEYKFVAWHGFGVQRGREKGCPFLVEDECESTSMRKN
jgi:hypothetical protein